MSDGAGAAVAAPDIRRIGVIGAGQMGRGIAHVCALAGLDVLLSDVDAEVLTKVRQIPNVQQVKPLQF